MKAVTSKIFFITFSIIMSVISLIFMVVNLRSFFALDWMVFADKTYGFFSSLSKIIIWSIGASSLPLTIVYLKYHSLTFRMYVMIYALSCFLGGVVLALIFKTDAGVIPMYYILPASLVPTGYAISFYFYEINR